MGDAAARPALWGQVELEAGSERHRAVVVRLGDGARYWAYSETLGGVVDSNTFARVGLRSRALHPPLRARATLQTRDGASLLCTVAALLNPPPHVRLHAVEVDETYDTRTFHSLRITLAFLPCARAAAMDSAAQVTTKDIATAGNAPQASGMVALVLTVPEATVGPNLAVAANGMAPPMQRSADGGAQPTISVDEPDELEELEDSDIGDRKESQHTEQSSEGNSEAPDEGTVVTKKEDEEEVEKKSMGILREEREGDGAASSSKSMRKGPKPRGQRSIFVEEEEVMASGDERNDSLTPRKKRRVSRVLEQRDGRSRKLTVRQMIQRCEYRALGGGVLYQCPFIDCGTEGFTKAEQVLEHMMMQKEHKVELRRARKLANWASFIDFAAKNPQLVEPFARRSIN